MEETNIVTNRKASHEYHFLSSYSAGIQLTGTEIKSVRANQVNLGDAYCIFINDEFWVKNLHIAIYKEGSYNNHEEKRDRKLLLTKNELRKLKSKLSERGLTVVPVRMFINERGFAKLEIAVARGKKTFDKRQDIKERDMKRELQRKFKI